MHQWCRHLRLIPTTLPSVSLKSLSQLCLCLPIIALPELLRFLVREMQLPPRLRSIHDLMVERVLRSVS